MDELSEAIPQEDLTFHIIEKLTQPPFFYYQPINQPINQPLKFYIMGGNMGGNMRGNMGGNMRGGFLENNNKVFKWI